MWPDGLGPCVSLPVISEADPRIRIEVAAFTTSFWGYNSNLQKYPLNQTFALFFCNQHIALIALTHGFHISSC